MKGNGAFSLRHKVFGEIHAAYLVQGIAPRFKEGPVHGDDLSVLVNGDIIGGRRILQAPDKVSLFYELPLRLDQVHGALCDHFLQKVFFPAKHVLCFFYTQHDLYLRDQFRLVNGLGEEGIGADFKPFYPAGHICSQGREQDNRDMPGQLFFFKEAACFKAVHSRHFDVKYNRVRLFCSGFIDPFRPGKRGQNRAVAKKIFQQS